MMKGFRTVIFNIVMVIVMVIKAVYPESELPDEETVASTVDAVEVAIGMVWSTGNLILRAVTDSPIFKKEPSG